MGSDKVGRHDYKRRKWHSQMWETTMQRKLMNRKCCEWCSHKVNAMYTSTMQLLHSLYLILHAVKQPLNILRDKTKNKRFRTLQQANLCLACPIVHTYFTIYSQLVFLTWLQAKRFKSSMFLYLSILSYRDILIASLEKCCMLKNKITRKF